MYIIEEDFITFLVVYFSIVFIMYNFLKFFSGMGIIRKREKKISIFPIEKMER